MIPFVYRSLDASKSFGKAENLSGLSLSSFLASISTSVAIFVIEVGIFLFIRKRFPIIYYSDGRKQPSVHVNESFTGILGTVSQLVRFEFGPDDLHLDRYFFRRYIRTLLTTFLPATLLVTTILIPLNYIDGKGSIHGVSGLDTLGWSNVGLEHCDRYWAHLILSLFLISYVFWIIWTELEAYVAIRQSSPHASLRTVLVDSIPSTWMTEETLKPQFSPFPGGVESISFNQDFTALSRRVKARKILVQNLEDAETRMIRKASIRSSGRSFSFLGFGGEKPLFKEDSISILYQELQRVNREIEADREAADRFERLPSAFVTFDNPIAAHMCCQTVIHTKSGFMTPRMLLVAETDVVWDNVCIDWWNRSIRTVCSNVSITIIAMLCVVPAAFAGLLSQIIYLTRAVQWLQWVDDLPSWLLGCLQGIVPPVLLAVLLKVFSTALIYLVKMQGIASKSLISLKVQDFYFYFLFVQVTLIVSLAAGVTAITDEIASGQSLAATLAKNLPKASNYFLSYVLLQALSVSANSLLCIDRLLGKFVLGPVLDKSLSRMHARAKGQDIEWGVFVPIYTNLACIGLLYAIISPIIIPFQLLIFSLFFIIYSYSPILFTKRDSGGLFYPNAMKQLLVGVYLMEVGMSALFLLVRDSRGKVACIGQACFMMLAIALTAVFHHLVCKAFDPLLYFSPTCLPHPRSSPNGQPAQSIYRHKALKSSPTIRIPRDDYGHSALEVQSLQSLEGINIVHEARMSTSGRIHL